MFLDHSTGNIFMASTCRPYHAILTEGKSGSKLITKMPDCRIMGSAQSPAASQLALVDDQQRIYRADLTTRRATLVIDLAAQPHQKDSSWQSRHVALATPNDSTIYLLWSKDSELLLATVQAAVQTAAWTATTPESLRGCFDDGNRA